MRVKIKDITEIGVTLDPGSAIPMYGVVGTKNGLSFMAEMLKYCNKIVKIEYVGSENTILLEDNKYLWHSEWLESIEKRPQRK
jgi:hypothetical protein